MRNEISLTNEQIEALFEEAFKVGVNLDEEYGVDVVFTRETLENFDEASNNYAECDKPVFGEADGFRTLVLSNARPSKGTQKRDVHVIDFGTVRACFQ